MIIVEDGTGIKDSNSFVGLPALKVALLPTRPSDELIEQYSKKAFDFLESIAWPGKRITKHCWPRVLPGETLSEKKKQRMPEWIKLAQIALVKEFASGSDISPNRARYDASGRQITESTFTKPSALLSLIDNHAVRKRV